MSAIFLPRFVRHTDIEIIPHALTPTSIIPTKFEVDMTIHCRVVAFLSADTLRDFVTWTFDLKQLLCMAGHVPNRTTKFEDRMPISSWFMSHNVSRWLPLRMRTRPLRMRRITWSVSRGSKTITFLTWFAYSLCTVGGSTMNVIKVIRENNARPCVKRPMSFGACAKSRDLLKVT